MKQIVLHPEARKELDEAVAFYEEKRAGLGLDFLEKVGKAWNRISRFPKASAVFEATTFRKCTVAKYPYVVFFEEFEDHLLVIAIAHSKRKPGYWRDRGAAPPS